MLLEVAQTLRALRVEYTVLHSACKDAHCVAFLPGAFLTCGSGRLVVIIGRLARRALASITWRVFLRLLGSQTVWSLVVQAAHSYTLCVDRGALGLPALACL